MAKSTSLMLPQNANNSAVTLTPTDTTTAKTCFTAGSNDSNVKAILVTSNDTAAVNLQLYLRTGGTDYLLATVNVPIAAGTNGTVAAVDLLNSISSPGLAGDAVGKRYLSLKTGDTLKVGCLATMTTAKTCYVSCIGEDY